MVKQVGMCRDDGDPRFSKIAWHVAILGRKPLQCSFSDKENTPTTAFIDNCDLTDSRMVLFLWATLEDLGKAGVVIAGQLPKNLKAIWFCEAGIGSRTSSARCHKGFVHCRLDHGTKGFWFSLHLFAVEPLRYLHGILSIYCLSNSKNLGLPSRSEHSQQILFVSVERTLRN